MLPPSACPPLISHNSVTFRACRIPYYWRALLPLQCPVCCKRRPSQTTRPITTPLIGKQGAQAEWRLAAASCGAAVIGLCMCPVLDDVCVPLLATPRFHFHRHEAVNALRTPTSLGGASVFVSTFNTITNTLGTSSLATPLAFSRSVPATGGVRHVCVRIVHSLRCVLCAATPGWGSALDSLS